jgi:hypothetical protein
MPHYPQPEPCPSQPSFATQTRGEPGSPYMPSIPGEARGISHPLAGHNKVFFMEPDAFKRGWEAVVQQKRAEALAAGVPEVAERLRLVSAPRQLLDTPAFPPTAARFLVGAGLPSSCAPFLSFSAVAKGPLLLARYYGVHQFDADDLPYLSPFYVIGDDSAGNPLCVDTAHDGEVVMLDHEDWFRTRTFVSSSVATLAQALLIIYTHPHTEFAEHLRQFDPRAADESAFLPGEVAMMIE